MENATKALIIAGAVLIAILLIGVGVMVFNAASDPINQAQNSTEAQAVRMFNESFAPYLGENITAQQAKSLISAVQSSNSKDEEHKVTITLDGKEEDAKVSKISTKNHYKAEETSDDAGYIKTIAITTKTTN